CPIHSYIQSFSILASLYCVFLPLSLHDALPISVLTVSGETAGAEKEDGWVQVDLNGTAAYVSADYVDVAMHVEEAMSMEEILEQDRKSTRLTPVTFRARMPSSA